MGDAMYHLIAIGVVALAIIRGYRKGLTGQVSSVLGVAFGCVCSHIFIDAASEVANSVIPQSLISAGGAYLASNIAATVVFFIIYGILKAATGIISKAMEIMGGGLLDSILGSLFCMGKYLLMLSMAYNILAGMNPQSSLVHHGKADDGNIVRGVMWLAPEMLGSVSFAEFAHTQQLREASKISCASIPYCNSMGA